MAEATTQGETYTVRLDTGETYGPAPMATILQWAREGRVPATAMLISDDGRPPVPVTSVPSIAAVFGGGDETWATIVPYRNPPALIGYYISIFSLLPILGMLAGPAAVVLGIIGLKKRKADARCKGAAHAWIAISLGSVGTLISASCLSLIFLVD